MTAIVRQRAVTDFTAGVGEDPRVVGRRIFELTTEANVIFRDLRFGVGGATFGAIPGGLFGGGFGGDWETSSGACSGEIGGLAGP